MLTLLNVNLRDRKLGNADGSTIIPRPILICRVVKLGHMKSMLFGREFKDRLRDSKAGRCKLRVDIRGSTLNCRNVRLGIFVIVTISLMSVTRNRVVSERSRWSDCT